MGVKANKASRKPQPGEKVVPVRCQPLTYPCPKCGRRGRRRHRYDRFVQSIAYGHVLWLHVFYAEYTARCDCGKYFRSCPPRSLPKAEYDNLVREAVLNRVLDDGLNVQRTRTAMKRDFLLELSSGFIYDCLEWGLARLGLVEQRRFGLEAVQRLPVHRRVAPGRLHPVVGHRPPSPTGSSATPW
jgi:hypothetical protein